jgi:4,5-dihydroxyphthalate decarboxylase
MATIHLKMVVPLAPWTRAAADGTVTLSGVSWECSSSIGRTPERFDATKQADVGENGVRRLAIEILKGAPAVAIPVFFGREHMQRNIVVREDSGLSHPGELAGKRIGSATTAVSGTNVGVMLLLEKAYGLRVTDLEWHVSDIESLPENRMGLTLKRGPATDEESLDRLARGELDAAILRTGPRYWSMFGQDKLDQALAGRAGLRPLVNDPETIARTYRRTGLYPITDVGVVSADVARLHPELALRLVEALSRANDLAPRYRSGEEEALARREIDLLGEDPHQYRLDEKARRNLAALLDLLARLGAIEKAIEPEELFLPAVRAVS